MKVTYRMIGDPEVRESWVVGDETGGHSSPKDKNGHSVLLRNRNLQARTRQLQSQREDRRVGLLVIPGACLECMKLLISSRV